jgi:hypothetical protein
MAIITYIFSPTDAVATSRAILPIEFMKNRCPN